jgi:hypothetical protein
MVIIIIIKFDKNALANIFIFTIHRKQNFEVEFVQNIARYYYIYPFPPTFDHVAELTHTLALGTRATSPESLVK